MICNSCNDKIDAHQLAQARTSCLFLQGLTSITLDACSITALLGELLGLCADLPVLTKLSLSYWGLEMVVLKQLQQHPLKTDPEHKRDEGQDGEKGCVYI
jgi:hypothetical protein